MANIIVKDGKVYKIAYRGEISKQITENEDNVLYKNNRILKENGIQVQEFVRKRD